MDRIGAWGLANVINQHNALTKATNMRHNGSSGPAGNGMTPQEVGQLAVDIPLGGTIDYKVINNFGPFPTVKTPGETVTQSPPEPPPQEPATQKPNPPEPQAEPDSALPAKPTSSVSPALKRVAQAAVLAIAIGGGYAANALLNPDPIPVDTTIHWELTNAALRNRTTDDLHERTSIAGGTGTAVGLGPGGDG